MIKQRNNCDSFDSQLKSAGYTEQTFKDSIKQSLAFQEGLKKHIKLTDEDLKRLGNLSIQKWKLKLSK